MTKYCFDIDYKSVTLKYLAIYIPSYSILFFDVSWKAVKHRWGSYKVLEFTCLSGLTQHLWQWQLRIRLKPLFQKRLTEAVNVFISDIPQVGDNGWAGGEQSVAFIYFSGLQRLIYRVEKIFNVAHRAIFVTWSKPANNFCLQESHLLGQRQVMTWQKASLVGPIFFAVRNYKRYFSVEPSPKCWLQISMA